MDYKVMIIIVALVLVLFLSTIIEPSITGNVLWGWDHCSSSHPCPAGEGDCDRDSDCITGYCASNVGTKYGKTSSMDVCEDKGFVGGGGSGGTIPQTPTTNLTEASIIKLLNSAVVNSMLTTKSINPSLDGNTNCGSMTCIANYFSEVPNPTSSSFTLQNTIRAGCNEKYNGNTESYYIQSVCVFAGNNVIGCTDSDRGENFLVKGTVVGYPSHDVEKIPANLQTVEDFCFEIAGEKWVQEYVCMSNDLTSQYYGVFAATSTKCIDCVDGACTKVKEIISCEGSTNGSADAYSYGSQIKVGFNDGTQEIYTDDCGRGSGSGDVGLVHYFCGNTSSGPHFWAVLTPCPNGCKNGTCVNEEYIDLIITGRSVDRGEIFNVSVPDENSYVWTLKSYDRNYLESRREIDSCTTYGFCDHSYEFRALKDGQTIIELNKIRTSDRKLVQIHYEYMNINSTPFSGCVDSDNGKDYYVKGITHGIQENGNFEATSVDICMTSDGSRLYLEGASVLEYYCDGNYTRIDYHYCPNGCKNGACISENEEDKCIAQGGAYQFDYPTLTNEEITWMQKNNPIHSDIECQIYGGSCSVTRITSSTTIGYCDNGEWSCWRPDTWEEPGKCITKTNQSSKEQTCLAQGGQVKTSFCCTSASDFPNNCLIGICGCPPEGSRDVKTCICPTGKCWDGENCVANTDCHTKPLWDWSYCTKDCPCPAGEGDCDRDSDCITGKCSQNVGRIYGQSSTMDVCE